ncbi:TetR/AcrR family transcriptional regulator [Roseovarius pelagicus]|uniref:TetR/AcrR family transcriptional regulator n=1 Tax=Roseovarius pelagicus TaxID=2980108 RepID=A0ABY6DGH4_9RHOB|nr:TetR/AcrR family transcriptional regulator [Roseovarius pelagicus]UXX82880.1 TetR/AcrR family transcriptional regulator [Roseovarius pelagicus]
MARTQGSHSGTTRPRVRAAALRLFAQHGYAAVSMRKIAAEVGVQAGALYNYTPDKQSLLFDLMQSHMYELLGAWADVPGRCTPLEALEAFTRFHIRFHSRRPDDVFVSYMELRNLEPGNFGVIEALRRDYEEQLETIIRDGIASGDFVAAEPKVAAMAVIAMLNGVNTWFREAGRLSLEDVEALYWEMVRKAVSV